MYVYKISDSKSNKVYIGVDTKPKEKLGRWYDHLRLSKKNPHTKFYKELARRPQDFNVEVVFESESVGELFIKESQLISEHDSYRNGYNSTIGGDCFGVVVQSDEHYQELVEIFKERMVEFNVVKWGHTTLEERQQMIKHCHTPESNAKRSRTVKKLWEEADSHERDKRLRNLKEYISSNHEKYVKSAKAASDIAAEKKKRPITIRNRETGELLHFDSIKSVRSELKTCVRYLERLKKSGKIGSKKWELIINE